MNFPVTQAELVKAVHDAGFPADWLLDAELVIQAGGRLFFKLTSGVEVDGQMMAGDDGEIWKTYYYVPLDKLTNETQH